MKTEILNLLQLAQSKLISQGYVVKTSYRNESEWQLLSYVHENEQPDTLSIENICSRDVNSAIHLGIAADKGRTDESDK